VTSEVDHDQLNDALKRCGASWTAAQSHGLLSSRLAVAGERGVVESLRQVLDGSSESDAACKECEVMLGALAHVTRNAFVERLSAFEPLLPDDDDRADIRTEALAHWCEGYLHGLVSGEHDATLKARLAAEPLADIIKDMLQITRATVDDDEDEDSHDEAYVEIVEYIRVAAQLFYEELAELRPETLQ
jgi:uncharacterized protein YgfB (UPF0149 family)